MTDLSFPGLALVSRFEAEGQGLRVKQCGRDLFAQLSLRPEVRFLELPPQEPYSAYATTLLLALGFQPESEVEAGALRLVRSTDPTAEQQQFEAGLRGVVAQPPLDLDQPDGDLSHCREAWMRRARQLNPASFAGWADRFWMAGRIGAASPVFVARSEARRWKDAAERVLGKLHEAVAGLADDEEMRWHIFGSRSPLPGNFPPFARFDGCQQEAGPVFFELNVGAVGFLDTDRTGALYRTLDLEQSPAQISPVFASLLSMLEGRKASLGADRWLVMPVAEAEEHLYSAGTACFMRLLHSAGWRAHFCPLRSLTYQDGVLRTAEGREVGLLARAYFANSPGTEVVEQAIREGAVELLNPPSAHGNKGLFEVVADPALPWTRVLCSRETTDPEGQPVDLASYALASRCQLVLKPSDGHGGRGVLLGANTDPDLWERAVLDAVHDYPKGRRSILQKASPIPSQSFVGKRGEDVCLHWDCNAFLFEGVFGGLAARLSPTAITNISQGGGAVPVYVV